MDDAVAFVLEAVAPEAPHHRALLFLSSLAVVVMSPAIMVHDQRPLVADLEPLPEDVLLAGLVPAEEAVVRSRNLGLPLP